MNILITGGTGFIGSKFIDKTCARYKFTVLSRDPKLFKRPAKGKVQFIDNLSQYNNLNSFNAVINLAGEPIADKRWTKQHKEKICQSRWQITQQLVDLFERSVNPPNVFISGSAVGYYGRQSKQVISENFDDYFDDFPHALCQEWEDIALKAQKLTRVCIVRTGLVLGKNKGVLKKMLPPFRLGLGGKMASGEQYMPWIHIKDMVDILDYLLNHKTAAGVFNVSSPNAVTNKEFSDELANTLNRWQLLPLPERFLRLVFGEMADLLIYGQNVYPEKLIKLGYEFKYPNLTEAFVDLLKNKPRLTEAP